MLMPTPDFWGIDSRVLQTVVELQASHGGTFPLDSLIDRVASVPSVDLVEIGTVLDPWTVTESLSRLSEAGFILLAKETDDPETMIERLILDSWELHGTKHKGAIQEWKRRKQRFIEEAFYKGAPSHVDSGGLAVSAYWRARRFYINDVQQFYSVRATSDGLRRVGAWPNPERFTEELVAILGDIAESIEKQRPEDARTLRQIGRVLKANAIELSAAVLAKLLEHAAGL
jgi:hypothetical protein